MPGATHMYLVYWILAWQEVLGSSCLYYKLNTYIFRAQGVKQSYIFSFLPFLLVESRSSLVSTFMAMWFAFPATQKLCFDKKSLLKYFIFF